VPRNLNNAGQLYSLAANQGHAGATFALAQLFGKGIGTKPDPVKAWALATLAEERGEKDAKTYANEIASKFDDTQRAAARKELEDIKAGKSSKPADAPPAEAPKPADPK
jgi:TPR repeat protein